MSLGLIIEGIPLTGKSTLLRGLEKSRNLQELSSSKLIYHEELTQRVLEKDYNKGFLDKTSHINFLMDITTHLEKQAKLLNRRGFADDHLAFILERFHITHAAYYPYISLTDISPIDDILASLNTKIVLLTVNRDNFRNRLRERQNTKFIHYIKRYGSDIETILDHYMKSQEHYIDLVSQSKLSVEIIDSNLYSPKEVLEKTLAFWLQA